LCTVDFSARASCRRGAGVLFDARRCVTPDGNARAAAEPAGIARSLIGVGALRNEGHGRCSREAAPRDLSEASGPARMIADGAGSIWLALTRGTTLKDLPAKPIAGFSQISAPSAGDTSRCRGYLGGRLGRADLGDPFSPRGARRWVYGAGRALFSSYRNLPARWPAKRQRQFLLRGS